jgi:hypothetical protein
VTWETERETIQRETQTQRANRADWNTDVIVPAGQSLLIATGVAVGSFVLTAALTLWLHWRFWIPLAVAGAMGGLSFALAAVLLTLDHRRLLWAAEAALGVDLDQDDVVGKPEPPEVLRVELLERQDGNNTRLAFIDLPGNRGQLVKLAEGLLAGKGTGEAQWTGSDNPFSRSEFSAIRATLIERGLATWINPSHHAQGWELTAAGRAVMRRIAQVSADRPTPRRKLAHSR